MGWSLSNLFSQDSSDQCVAPATSTSPALQDGLSASLLASAGALGNAGLAALLGLGGRDGEDVQSTKSSDTHSAESVSSDTSPDSGPAPLTAEELELQEALQAVRDMIAAGAGKAPQASANLQHWLDGSGSTLTMPESLFTEHRKFLRHLRRSHRSEFEAGARRRIESGELTAGGTALMTWTDSMNASFPSDLYYALGGFTVDSTVVVRASDLGDGRWQVSFESWGVQISDRYNWDPGKSTLVPGFGVIEDSELRALEEAGYGKPFDVTAAFTVSDEDSLAPLELEVAATGGE